MRELWEIFDWWRFRPQYPQPPQPPYHALVCEPGCFRVMPNGASVARYTLLCASGSFGLTGSSVSMTA